MDSKAIAILCVPVIALVAFVTVFAKWGIAAAVGFWVVIVIAMVAWSLQQGWRARREIRGEIERAGDKVVRIDYRYLRLGPYSLWDTSRSQHVYRVAVQQATGHERIVWARWGRRWLFDPDALELTWEGETSPR